MDSKPLADELAALPVGEPAVLEAFQAGLISSGKAAQFLGLSKAGFLQLLDQRGLASLDMDLEELERQAAVALAASCFGTSS